MAITTQYLRLTVTGVKGYYDGTTWTDHIELAIAELKISLGGINVSLAGSSVSLYNPGENSWNIWGDGTLDRLVDNNLSTKLGITSQNGDISPNNSAIITINVGSNISFDEYSIFLPSYYPNESIYDARRDPISWTLGVSYDEGANWTVVSTKSFLPNDTDRTNTDILGPYSVGTTCFVGSTKVLMGDMTYRKISDLCVGDEIIEDISTNTISTIKKISKIFVKKSGVIIKKDIINNFSDIICTQNHIFYIPGPTKASNIIGKRKYDINEFVYNIQLDHVGTFYVEGVKVETLHPKNIYNPYVFYNHD
jgi:hypothetical protein